MATVSPRETRAEGRVPPHDLDAEQSVLGSILQDPEAIARVLDLLRPEDFYRENHAQIYKACERLFQDGEPIDNVTVTDQLDKLGVLERVGGRAGLLLLQESVPTAANIEYYARIVRARSDKRKLIRAGGNIAGLGYDAAVEAEEALSAAQAEVYKIAGDRLRADFDRLYDLLRPAMDKIDAQMASGKGVVGIPSGFHDLDRMTSGFKPGELVVIAGRPGIGKALALDTPIPTPDGWKTMGDLRVGEQVFDETGRPCTVTLATPVLRDRVCYAVAFSDGSVITADAEHLWATSAADGGGNTAATVRTTEELRDTLRRADGTPNHAIPACKHRDLLPSDGASNLATVVTSHVIIDIRPTPSVPVRCIQVDSPSHLYLAGDACIPTHNTSFALNIALQVATELKVPTAMFSLEMSKEQLVERLLCEHARIDAQRMHRGQLSETEYDRLAQSLGPLSEAPIFIDDAPMLDELMVVMKSRQIQLREKIGLILIDYLQLMHGRSRGDDANRVQEVSAISRALKMVARELRVPVLAISQLSRAVEQRQDKRPMLSDLRESGCLSGETPIYLPTEGRYVPIRELAGRSGIGVQAVDPDTWRLETGTVTNAFSTGRKPVHKLTTKLGRTIRATANHKFLTVSGWLPLGELVPGDRIALPRRLTGPDCRTLRDCELALAGHLVGDGCTLPTHVVQYTTIDRGLAETVAHLTREVFGGTVTPRISAERAWIQVYLTSSGDSKWSGSPVRAWLEALGLYGLRSYEKRVPEIVFAQDVAGIATFLRHLWSTDGCIHLSAGAKHCANIYYATSSPHLAQGVQSLLLRLGITAAVRRVPQARGRDQHQVWVSGRSDMLRFLELVGALGESKVRHAAAIKARLTSGIENTNRDIIPAAIWKLHALPALASSGLTHRQFQSGMGTRYCGSTPYNQNLSRERASRVATLLRSTTLTALASSDVYWDAIAGIEADGIEEVFDLTVEGLHNFVAGDIIVHNSIEQDSDMVMFLYRADYYREEDRPGIAEVILAKNRNGPTGKIELKFVKDQTRFYNLEARRPEPV